MSISRLFATCVALQLLCSLGSNDVFAQGQPGQRNPFDRPPSTGGFNNGGGPAGNPANGGGAPAGGNQFNNGPLGGGPGIGGGPGMGGPGGGGASQPSQPRQPFMDSAIAVIDTAEVFKQHARFKQSMEDMKEYVKDFQTKMQTEEQSINKEQKRLSELNPGTSSFKELEEKIAQRISDFQVKGQLKQRELQEREAKIYFDIYKELEGHVNEFAIKNGIRLVLRYNKMEMDPAKRDTVLQGINRPIVYQFRCDITDDIIARCNSGLAMNNRGGTTGNGGTGNGSGTRPAIPQQKR